MLAASPISPDHLINHYGVAGLLLIIFAECGLLIGFFLPGDTLLFACGLLLATGKIHTPLAVVLILLPVAATVGNAVGYWVGILGRAAGVRSAQLRGSFGPSSSIGPTPSSIGGASSRSSRPRFVPIVRTVATVLAGVGADAVRSATWPTR